MGIDPKVDPKVDPIDDPIDDPIEDPIDDDAGAVREEAQWLFPPPLPPLP